MTVNLLLSVIVGQPPCSGVRQRNFDWHICADCEIDAGDHKEVYKELSQNLTVSVISGCVHYKPVVKFSQYSYTY